LADSIAQIEDTKMSLYGNLKIIEVAIEEIDKAE